MPSTSSAASERERRLRRLERLAGWMDSALRVPGTQIRVGLDSLVGLVPGIGDTAALAPAAYILYEARDLGMPNGKLARMGLNVAIDYVIGAIPVLGDIFDVGWKANRRNVALLRQHFEENGGIIDVTPEPEQPWAPEIDPVQPTISRPEKK